ncbi:aldo/keto reductase [Pseudomonas alloputida]|uniref:Aldo/keto reductase n=1 Tax=Pseudomonas alloputida TaxID=1940621 RepID=A0ABY3D5R0_9PSED|nr:aldo/keto reductase [Pseudomonas alloputida]TRZ60973.1 aldo/keto reductase [Pseudomonas alloputida]
MTAQLSSFQLNNGVAMPAVGLGVFQSGPQETVGAVSSALQHGYRMIDTAAAYANEAQVGQGIRESGIARDEVFVITKLKPADYGYDSALRAFDSSEQALGLEVLDLYLLHWPMPKQFESTLASWQAAERLLAEGRVRAIGVCNFRESHLDALMARSEVVPALNQVELHPFLVQNELREAHRRLGIVTQAWSPLGGVNRYWNSGEDPLSHPLICRLAEQYGKTPAQIILRWQLQRGASVIPKSVRPERIAENFALFDFSLDASDVSAIDALDQNRRGGPNPDTR